MNNNPEIIYQKRCWNSYFENSQKRWPTITDFFYRFCSLNSLQFENLLLFMCFCQPQSPSGCCSHLLRSRAQAQQWGTAQLFQLKSKHNRRAQNCFLGTLSSSSSDSAAISAVTPIAEMGCLKQSSSFSLMHHPAQKPRAGKGSRRKQHRLYIF